MANFKGKQQTELKLQMIAPIQIAIEST